MENGVKGEARTYALLAEHFWVLERKVDINGADFIIQRTFLDKDISLDLDYPRLGIVQSKYVSKETEVISIDKTYVYDGDDIPRRDFILIIHNTKTPSSSYSISEKVIYCLTSEEIDKLIYEDKLSIVKKKSKDVINITIKNLREKCEIYPNSEMGIIKQINEALENADYYGRISLYKYLTKELNLNQIEWKYKDTTVATSLLNVKTQAQELIKKMLPLLSLLTEITDNEKPEMFDKERIQEINTRIIEYSKIICENNEDRKELSELLYALKGSIEFAEGYEFVKTSSDPRTEPRHMTLMQYIDLKLKKESDKSKAAKETIKQFELLKEGASSIEEMEFIIAAIDYIQNKYMS